MGIQEENMVAEITSSQNSNILNTKTRNISAPHADFEKNLNQKIQASQTSCAQESKNTFGEQNLPINIGIVEAHSIYYYLYGDEPKTPREYLEAETKRKMDQYLLQLNSDYISQKYPYGSVFTSDDNGNILSGKIYKADGTYSMADQSEFPNSLVSKDLNSIISVMSDDDLKKYCESKENSTKSFVELLQKYDKEGKFDEKISKKLEVLPEQFNSYTEALRIRAEEETKKHWYSFLLPDIERPYQTAYNQLKESSLQAK